MTGAIWSTSCVVSPVALHRLWLPSRNVVSTIPTGLTADPSGVSCQRAPQPVGPDRPGPEIRMSEHVEEQLPVGRHPGDLEFLESLADHGQRLGAVLPDPD